MDLCVLVAFRQTNGLSVDNRASEVRMRSRPEIHLFTKMRRTKREDADGGKKSGESEEDI